MASISKNPRTGAKRILFVGPLLDADGKPVLDIRRKPRVKRRATYLGNDDDAEAQEVKTIVEAILRAKKRNRRLYKQTEESLDRIREQQVHLYGKLANVGLVEPRVPPPPPVVKCLQTFIDDYIASRTDAKPRTLLNLGMFRDRLIDYFKADKPLAEIKRGDADRWVIWLKEARRKNGRLRFAPATIGRTIKGARQFFKAAVADELIDRNPFDGIKAGSHVDKARKRFVTPEEIKLVIDQCPNAEWRLSVALSRWAGLRCPSEHLALTWQDVDRERERFLVRSPKTGERWVPIFPELRPYLQEVFDHAEPGAVHVITSTRDSSTNLRTRFAKIIRRAGLKAWPKLFHNLRASRQTELVKKHPLHVVCSWLGNSGLIAQKHYLQVTDADFALAARAEKIAQKTAQKVAQKAAQSPFDSFRQELPGESQVVAGCADTAENTGNAYHAQYARRESNPQPAVPKTAALSS